MHKRVLKAALLIPFLMALNGEGAVFKAEKPRNFASLENSFQQAVSQNRYDRALRLVCHMYGLNCRNITVEKSDDIFAPYAETHLTGKIVVFTHTFRFTKGGQPHSGWVGAIIGHELVHRQQGSIGRVYAQLERIYRNDHSIIASREFTAWNFMWKNRNYFNLTCGMVVKVFLEVEYFGEVLANEGRLPKNRPAGNARKVHSDCQKN